MREADTAELAAETLRVGQRFSAAFFCPGSLVCIRIWLQPYRKRLIKTCGFSR